MQIHKRPILWITAILFNVLWTKSPFLSEEVSSDIMKDQGMLHMSLAAELPAAKSNSG